MISLFPVVLLCVMSPVFGMMDKIFERLNYSCVRKLNSEKKTYALQCLDENSSKLSPNDKATFSNKSCFCDARCFDYGDCCLDISYPKDSGWSCRKLPSNKGVYIFMKQSCKKDWMDDGIRNLCEEETEYLWENNQRYHHLQDLPVYSTSTKTIYRNVFCAICNEDNFLQKWKAKIKCDQNLTLTGGLESDAVYLPSERKWMINTTEGNVKCWMQIDELQNFSEVVRIYDGRRCKGISTCSPSWTNSEDRIRCAQNDGLPQFIYFYRFRYKNPSCARCNNVSETLLSCNELWYDVYSEYGSVWYPLLIDFNFDDLKNSCERDELYDPVLRSCLSLSCGQSYKKIGDKCVIKANQTNNMKTLNDGCFKVLLGRELFVVLENDVIYVNHTGKLYSKEEYEAVVTDGSLKEILICAEEVIDFNFSPVQYWMSEIGLMISICCLLIHLVVYLILPKLRNLPGKILMCLSISLLLGQTSFLLGAYGENQGIWYCRIIAVFTHLSHLAAFFWMNVMALDICRTFCGSRPRSEHSYSFLKYSLYAWTLPLIITVVGLIMDFTASQSLYAPRYGRNVCWINQKRAVLIFFALPLAVLLLANIVMFIMTARSLKETACQTKIARKFSDKVRFLLYVKIALILGLTWIFGFLATLTKQEYLWYPFIIFSTLQGAFIFLSFTVKRKVWKLLKERFGARKGDKKGKAVDAKHYSSTSNLSTLQTSLTTSLSASVPVLCNQKEIVQAIMKGNFQTFK